MSTRYIKAIPTESEGILHVLGAPFFGPHKGADSDGQFFDPDTDFMDEAGLVPPVFYWHGSRTKSIPFQIAEVTKTWMTDEGRWYEVSLFNDSSQLASNVVEMGQEIVSEVMETIKSLWKSAKNGTLFASTGAVPASVIIEKSGRIAQWLVGELSLIDANLDEGRVPANFYASAIPVKFDNSAFEERLSKEPFQFENLTIAIPGGTVPASDENQLANRLALEDSPTKSQPLVSSVSHVLSDVFSQVIDADDGSEDELSDVLMDVIENGLRELSPMMDATKLATDITDLILNSLSNPDEQKNHPFDGNFIQRAFEQAFLEVFQTFRRGTMPQENNDNKTTTAPATPPTTDPAIAAQLEAMKAEMESMKSSNEALTAQLRKTEATAATAQSEAFLNGLVQNGQLVASEVEAWNPVLKEAFSIDTAIKSSGGEATMLNLIMEAMKSRPQANILGDGNQNGDGKSTGDDAPIKSGTILSTSAGNNGAGPDHTKVDPATLNEMRRYAGVPAPKPQ